MYGLDEELDGELDHDWIRSLLAAGVDGIGEDDGGRGGGGILVGAVSREQALAAGRARLARRRLSAGVVVTVAAVLAVAGYVIGSTGEGAPGGSGAVTASTTPSVVMRQGPAISTAHRIDPSPTPSAS